MKFWDYVGCFGCIICLISVGIRFTRYVHKTYTPSASESLEEVIQFESDLVDIEIEINEFLQSDLYIDRIDTECNYEKFSHQVEYLSENVYHFTKSVAPYHIEDVISLMDQFEYLDNMYQELVEDAANEKEIFSDLHTQFRKFTNERKLMKLETRIDFLKQKGINLKSFWSEQIIKNFSEENSTKIIEIMKLIMKVTQQFEKSGIHVNLNDQLFRSEALINQIRGVKQEASNLQQTAIKKFRHIIGQTYYRLYSSITRITNLGSELIPQIMITTKTINESMNLASKKYESLQTLAKILNENIQRRQIEIPG